MLKLLKLLTLTLTQTHTQSLCIAALKVEILTRPSQSPVVNPVDAVE